MNRKINCLLKTCWAVFLIIGIGYAEDVKQTKDDKQENVNKNHDEKDKPKEESKKNSHEPIKHAKGHASEDVKKSHEKESNKPKDEHRSEKVKKPLHEEKNKHSKEHKKIYNSNSLDLGSRIEILEKKINDATPKPTTNVSVTGNINTFAVFYPKQRIGFSNYTTNPMLVMMNAQGDDNGQNPGIQKNQFMLSADESTLSTKVKNKDFLAQFDIGAYANTLSNGIAQNPSFFVSDIHAEFMNFTIGYTASNFEDTDALGTWLSANTQQINYGICSVLLKYGFDISNDIKAAIALENPVQDGLEQYLYTDDNSGVTTRRIRNSIYGRIQEPDITLNIRYNMKKGFVGLRLLERKLLQNMDNNTYAERGYGAAVSGRFNFENKSFIYAQAVYGKGIGCYLGELVGLSFLFDTTFSGNPQLKALTAYSYTVGTQINITEKIFLNLAYQANHVDYPSFALLVNNDTSAMIPNFDTDHQKVLVNVLYQINDNVLMGLECAYVTRKIANTIVGDTSNQKSANAQSVMFGMKYTF